MMKIPPNEANAIQKIALWLDATRKDILLDDLSKVVRVENFEDSYRSKLYLEGYARPPYRGQHTYDIDAMIDDSNGAKVLFLLYADENDRLLEYEFIRFDSRDIVELKWDTLKLEWSRLA